MNPMDAPIPKALTALSPSKISDLHCPWRFEQIHVRGVTEPPIREFGVGHLVHLVAKDYYRELASEGIEGGDLDLLEQVIDRVWEQRGPEHTPDIYSEFREFSRNFQFRIFSPEEIAETELKLAFDRAWKPVPWDSERVRFGGIIDFLAVTTDEEGPIAIVRDWTCGGLGATLETKKDMQLRFYAMLIHRQYKIDRVRITVDSLRTGATRTIELGRHDHEATETWALQEHERLLALREAQEWPAMPGHLCELCQLDCPLVEGLEERSSHYLVRIQDERRAEEVAASILMHDRASAAEKKLLKAYVAFRGPVALNGMVAEPRPSRRFDFDYRVTRALLQDLGYDPDEVGELSSTNLKAHLCNPDHLEAVMATAKVTLAERFGLYKQKAATAVEKDEW